MAERSTRPQVRISVDRDVTIPLVNQVHDQVAAAIASGDLRPGDRLPTIRELAQFLRINRNTVAQAYRQLETSGHVQTRAGGGTTVAEGSSAATPVRQHELRGLVATALKEATQQGFTAQEFGRLAYYEGHRWDRLPRVAVLVVHDYRGELDQLRQAAADESAAVDARGLLLEDLSELVRDGRLEELGAIDFALAPVRLLERVMALLVGAPFPVLGAGIGPSLATLVQVARATSDQPRRVAVVCSDPAGAATMEDVLRSAGVTLGETRQAAVHEPGLRAAVGWADLVLVSDASVEAVAGLVEGKQVIRFSTMVSDSSLATVRGYIDHVLRVKHGTETSA
jgi:GntR family transcriptional regulator